MKYKCLLIDHDDTSVDSTPHIHYPAHKAQLRQLNREQEILSLEDWFKVNYHPGIRPYLREQLRLTTQEEQWCYQIWREHTLATDPPFFPGILELLEQFTRMGGTVIVISHSERDIIEGHYKRQQQLPGFSPKEIYGWTGKPEHTKPNTWPIDQVINRFAFKKEEMLMMDDLKPGIIMAQKAGIDSLGAGWSHSIPEIQEDLSRESTVFFDSIEKATKWILS
ncbi:MAG: HAD hydrolase-like protein [Spirochaetaceae bacterium]|jgi:beta-phosphoglucomutase-like phosphatase (HAD superfamily)|nr:HAD hydrolase-like protein [Spirochaetaceae bacterium]